MPDIPKGSKPNRNYTHQSSVVSWYNQQHAAEADRAAFPKDDAWAAVCTPCGFSTLPEPKKPAKWKTHLRLLRQFLSTCRA